jgi:hypothetical protein
MVSNWRLGDLGGASVESFTDEFVRIVSTDPTIAGPNGSLLFDAFSPLCVPERFLIKISL